VGKDLAVAVLTLLRPVVSRVLREGEGEEKEKGAESEKRSRACASLERSAEVHRTFFRRRRRGFQSGIVLFSKVEKSSSISGTNENENEGS